MNLSPQQQAALQKIADATQDFLFEYSRHQDSDDLKALAYHLGQMFHEFHGPTAPPLVHELNNEFYKGMGKPYDFQPREDRSLCITAEEMHDPKAEQYRIYSKAMKDALDAQMEGMHRLAEKEKPTGVVTPTIAAAIKRTRQAMLDQALELSPEKRKALTGDPWASMLPVPAALSKEPCPKCKGTGNMGMLGYVRCDACG